MFKFTSLATAAICTFLIVSSMLVGAAVQESDRQGHIVKQGRIVKEQVWRQFGHAMNWTISADFDSIDYVQDCWEIEVGQGRSQIVGDEKVVFVASDFATSEKSNLGTSIRAIQLETGKTLWEKTFESPRSDKQENFSGVPMSPQSTPLLTERWLVVVDFVGKLVCLDRDSGEIQWQKELPQKYGADFVQFGFSSSPMLDQTDVNRVLVLAAGKKAGLLCFDLKNGQLKWKSPVETFSYATPVLANFGGIAQWVLVSQNEILAIDANNGSQLWTWQLPKLGLTNVPTPLVVDKDRLLVAGQGVGGTIGLKIKQVGRIWSVEKDWFNTRLDLFCTNWLPWGKVVLACDDQALVSLDPATGMVSGRWRGFADGNIVRIGSEAICVTGQGDLTVLRKAAGGQGIELVHRFQMTKDRCWTPPSVIRDRILVRYGDLLRCLRINGNGEKILNDKIQTPELLEFAEETADSTRSADSIVPSYEADERSNEQLNVDQQLQWADDVLKDGEL